MGVFALNPAPSEIAYATHFAGLMHLMGYGQSTSIGVGAQSAITTGLYGALMLNTGLRVNSVDGGGVPTSLVPLVEAVGSSGYGETGVGSACNTFRTEVATLGGPAAADTGFALIGSTGGRGGMSATQLSEGNPYFAEMLGMVSSAFALSAAAGKTYSALGMQYTQGEADITLATPAATYRRLISRIFSRFTVDVRKITRQAWDIPIVMAQVASQMKYFGTGAAPGFRPEIALAQRALAQDADNVFCACPRYMLPYFDNVHHTAVGYEALGRYFGRALAHVWDARRKGLAKPPLAVDLKSALWQGKLIDLQFAVPVAPLAFDTATVTPATNQGFDLWSADGTTLLDVISSVNVAAPDRVVIACASAPPARARLSYGFGRPGVTTTSGPITGARGNLRDSAGAVDTYVDSTGATRRLDNFCLVFETVRPA